MTSESPETSLAIHQLICSLSDPPAGDLSPRPRPSTAFSAEHTLPILEGSSVTFAYRGEADAVLLQHFIYGLETSQPFQRLDGTDLWYLVIELPEESHLQYKINVIHGDEQHWILDPLNPHRALDPFGANSVVRTRGTERPAWTHPDPDARPGKIIGRTVDSDRFWRAEKGADLPAGPVPAHPSLPPVGGP